MAKGHVTQSDFRGGEWSVRAQGRIDDPNYVKALGTCRNSYPLEEGAWTRRVGTAMIGSTNFTYDGVIREFVMQDGSSGIVEIVWNGVAANARVWVRGSYAGFAAIGNKDTLILAGNQVAQQIVSISTANPAVLTMAVDPGWATGDHIVIYIDPTVAVTNAPSIRNRQFTVTKLTATTYSLVDEFTNTNVDGSTLGITSIGTSYAYRISTMLLPQTSLAAVKQIRAIQKDNTLFLVCPGFTTVFIQVVPSLTNGVMTGITSLAAFTVSYGALDGPYLDPPPGGSQTQNGLAHVVKGADWLHFTFKVDDGSYTFTADDVLKAIRIWTQPPPYNSSHSYAVGNVVTYQGQLWQAVIAQSSLSSATSPGSSQTDSTGKVWYPWKPVPEQGVWLVGNITAFTNSSTVTIALGGSASVTQAILQANGSFDDRNSAYYTDGGATITSTTGAIIDTFRIGAFGGSGTTAVFPTCGCLHGGRLWLGGALPGRIDGSEIATALDIPQPAVDTVLNFAPTDPFGNVLDSSGIDYTLSNEGMGQTKWMASVGDGILVAADNAEYLVQASNLSDPITPTSIQVHPSTKIQASTTPGVLINHALVFIQKGLKKVYEYVANVFGAGKFVGRPLNQYALHLSTGAGLTDIVYTDNPTPMIWTFNGDGNLLACTYRRVSNFPTEPPLFNGWHLHTLGHGRQIVSMCHGQGIGGATECVVLMTKDPNTGKCFIEMMTEGFFETSLLTDAWFVDASPISGNCGGGLVGTDNPTNSPPAAYNPAGGKFYMEFKIGAISNSGKGTGFQFGVANNTASLTKWLGHDANAAVKAFINSNDEIAGAAHTADATLNTNDFYGMAVDTINNKLWFKDWTSGPVGWIGGGDPSLGTGGYDISGLSGDLYLVFSGPAHPGNDAITINTGGSAFSGTMPTGFSAWDALNLTAWNTADAGKLTISGGVTNFNTGSGSTTQSIATSNGNRTATISTTYSDSQAINWNPATTYAFGNQVSAWDVSNVSGILYSLGVPVVGADPWSDATWTVNNVGIRSNTFKHRV